MILLPNQLFFAEVEAMLAEGRDRRSTDKPSGPSSR